MVAELFKRLFFEGFNDMRNPMDQKTPWVDRLSLDASDELAGLALLESTADIDLTEVSPWLDSAARQMGRRENRLRLGGEQLGSSKILDSPAAGPPDQGRLSGNKWGRRSHSYTLCGCLKGR